MGKRHSGYLVPGGTLGTRYLECLQVPGTQSAVFPFIYIGTQGAALYYCYVKKLMNLHLIIAPLLAPSSYAPVICTPGSLGAGDSGDIAGPKCRDLTSDESRQCRRCAGVLISRQNANLCHIFTRRRKLSLYICTV